MLVRQFIGMRLAEYYAQPAHRVVGQTPFGHGINFKNLWGGSWQWRRKLRRLYQQQQGQWLTPVELFRPYYSYILANFIADEFRNSVDNKLEVIDLGGGQGTNADLILTHLYNTQRHIYDRITYTIVDCSETLIEAQKSFVQAGMHADKVKLELKDLVDVAENRVSLVPYSKSPTVVLALELFDNLPHDKVRRDLKTRLLEQGMVVQSKSGDVNVDTPQPLPTSACTEKEIFVPLKDSVLSRVLLTLPSFAGATGLPAWVPTVACAILQRLGTIRPNASLVVADFDWLPPPDMTKVKDPVPRLTTWAEGEPLITSMDRLDHECYLQAAHPCDILFPVDFIKMASFVRRSWDDDRAVVKIQKQSQFLQHYGPDEINATKGWISGFTPLLHDFGNCSVLTVTRSQSNNKEKNPKS